VGLGFGDGRAGGDFASWQFGGVEVERGVRFGQGQKIFGGITRRGGNRLDEFINFRLVAFDGQEHADVFLVLDQLEQEARGIIARGDFFPRPERSWDDPALAPVHGNRRHKRSDNRPEITNQGEVKDGATSCYSN